MLSVLVCRDPEATVNLKSASFVVVMLLHGGLTHIQSQIKPRLLYGESFTLIMSKLSIITSSRRLCFHCVLIVFVAWLVSWLVCQQGYTATTVQIHFLKRLSGSIFELALIIKWGLVYLGGGMRSTECNSIFFFI